MGFFAFNRLNRLKKLLIHAFPTKLPITVNELSSMIDDVLEANDLPKDPTYARAIAAAVMHLGPVTRRKSKRFFAKSVHRQIANQAAFDKIQQLIKEEKEKLTPKDGDGSGDQTTPEQVVPET